MKIVKSFSEGAYVIASNGVEHQIFEGMGILPTDSVVGEVEFVEEGEDETDQSSAVSDEVAAIQAAILAGEDPTQIAPAAAVGPVSTDNTDSTGGSGHTFVALDNNLGEHDPTAGYPTRTFSISVEEPEDEIPLAFTQGNYIGLSNPLDDDEPILEKPNEENDPEVEPPVSEDPEPETPEDEPPSEDPPNDEPPEDEPPEEEPPEDPPEEPEDPEEPEEPEQPPEEDPKDEDGGKNNGWGNGDQDAPGNSGDNNNAENDPDGKEPPPGLIKNGKAEELGLEISDVLDEEETLEEMLPRDNAPKGPKGNNGWGNGDQDAPGNSLENNNAENNLDGLLSPTQQYYES